MIKSSLLSVILNSLNIYKLIRLTFTHGSETWSLFKAGENKIAAFEGKILHSILGEIEIQFLWSRRYNFELYKMYREANSIK